MLRPVIVGEPGQRHGFHGIRRACHDGRAHDGVVSIEVEPTGGGEPTDSTKSRARAVALVLAVVVVVAALAVIGTQWKVLPWVPDAGTVGAATPPDASSVPPEVGEPIDVATGLAVPWGLAFLPDGRALVGERPTGDVSVIARRGRRQAGWDGSRRRRQR